MSVELREVERRSVSPGALERESDAIRRLVVMMGAEVDRAITNAVCGLVDGDLVACAAELERIGDHCAAIARIGREMAALPEPGTDPGVCALAGLCAGLLERITDRVDTIAEDLRLVDAGAMELPGLHAEAASGH